MKTIYTLLFSLCFAFFANGQIRTYLMDCQYDATRFPSGTPWNDFFYNADQDIKDSTGNVTAHIKLSGWTQGNSSGTPSPTVPAITDFPTSTQTQDNIYSQGVGVEASILISGLNTQNQFTFKMFGSRAGVTDNRETMYVISGLNNDSASIDASNNTGNLAVVYNIKPDANGHINIVTKAGPNNNNSNKYFYLACFKILEYAGGTTSTNQISTKKSIYYSNNSIYAPESSGAIKIYSVTGSLLSKGVLQNGQYFLNLKSGIYIISLENEIKQLIVR